MIIKIFYDLETTGTDPSKHGIHQIAGIVQVDGEVKETFDIKVQPNPKAEVLLEALKVGGVTEKDLAGYMPMLEGYKVFIRMMTKYVDRYNPRDKAYLVGYNNRAFDDIFLRAWFEQNGDNYFGSYFWSHSLDVIVLATEYLLDRRVDMPSFKLKRVALELGLEVDESRLHDGAYDIELTMQMYDIVTGREMEL